MLPIYRVLYGFQSSFMYPWLTWHCTAAIALRAFHAEVSPRRCLHQGVRERSWGSSQVALPLSLLDFLKGAVIAIRCWSL